MLVRTGPRKRAALAELLELAPELMTWKPWCGRSGGDQCPPDRDLQVAEAGSCWAPCARLAEASPAGPSVAGVVAGDAGAAQGSLGEAEALADEYSHRARTDPPPPSPCSDLIEVVRWHQGRLQELRPAWQEQMARAVVVRRTLAGPDRRRPRRPPTRLRVARHWRPARRRPAAPLLGAAAVHPGGRRLHEPVAPRPALRLVPYRTRVIVSAIPTPVGVPGVGVVLSGPAGDGDLELDGGRWPFEAAMPSTAAGGQRAAGRPLRCARMLLARGQANAGGGRPAP